MFKLSVSPELAARARVARNARFKDKSPYMQQVLDRHTQRRMGDNTPLKNRMMSGDEYTRRFGAEMEAQLNKQQAGTIPKENLGTSGEKVRAHLNEKNPLGQKPLLPDPPPHPFPMPWIMGGLGALGALGLGGGYLYNQYTKPPIDPKLLKALGIGGAGLAAMYMLAPRRKRHHHMPPPGYGY